MHYASKPKGRRVRAFLPGGLMLLLVGVVWGCEGDNLFAPGPGAGLQLGPGIEFIDPEEEGEGVPLSDSVRLEAHLNHAGGIVSATYDGVAHRGDRDTGTHEEVQRFQPRTVDFDPPRMDTTLVRFLQPTGSDVAEQVYLRIAAEDVDGNIARDSIPVIVGGPSVQIPDLESGQTVSGNQDVEIRVTAADPTGVEFIELEITGVVEETFTATAFPDQDPTSVETTFSYTVPDDVTGEFAIRARARNSNEIDGRSRSIELTIVGEGELDTTPPEVRIVVDPQGSPAAQNRIEATDPVLVQVRATDNSGGAGVRIAGYTARVVRRANQADTLWVTDDTETTMGQGTVTRNFDPTMLTGFEDSNGDPFYDPINRPDTLDLDFFGWAEDDAHDESGTPTPNCAAAVSSDNAQQLSCEEITSGGDDFVVAEGENGQRVTLIVVSGETVRLPEGGTIADAVVDPDDSRRQLILSNIALGRLEMFDLETRTFGAPIDVGAQPWGLAFGTLDPDRLFVSNSGGTNISVVDVNTGQEIVPERILTPNTLLLDVSEQTSSSGITFEVETFDFSDRPQFLAQDADGRMVYSTRPTSVEPRGTIRVADTFDGETEVYLFTGHGTTQTSDNTFALQNVESFDLRAYSGGGGVVARQRRLHDTGTIVSDTILAGSFATPTAVNSLRGHVQTHLDNIGYGVGGPGAGAADYPSVFLPDAIGGNWDVGSVSLFDTTFVAASGDGRLVAIGEGATPGAGRIFLWKADATNPEISAFSSVQDLVGNASERVLGVAMNADGTLGVGRGILEAYFFDDDLRLQGTVALEDGGAGVALHPRHSEGPVLTNPDVALAFVPVGSGRIHIFDTVHFNRVGSVYIRDVITGPMKASLPYPSENHAGCQANLDGSLDLDASDDDCIAVKLSGISASGGVTVVNVTKADVTRDSP